MKKKSLILATAFAMALGVGVAVGAHQSKAGVKEVKADSVKLYVEIDSSMSWWQSDGAETHAHCWGGSAPGTEWPGAKMTLVEGEKNVYSVDIDSGYTSLIITRVNPANGAVWDRSSTDPGTPINLPADYTVANCFKLEHAGYNDGNYAGTWKLYSGSTPEPEPEKDDPSTEKNMFYVWDKYGLLGLNTESVNIYGFGQASNIKEMTWPGVHSNDYASVSYIEFGSEHVYRVELSVSYPEFIINNGTDQSPDITLGDFAGKLLVLGQNESYHWQEPSDLTNPPESNGYYILGDNTSSWTFTGATKLGEGDEDNYAVLTNFAVTKDNEYKIKSFFDGETAWFNYHDGEEETSFNYVAPDSNPKNVYLSKDGTFYVTDYIPPVDPDVPEHDGYYIVGSKSEWKYAGATELTGGEDEENYAKLLNYTVSAGESFKVRSHLSGVDTWFSINGAEGDEGNYSSETEKAVDIFASKDGKLYVSDHSEPVDPDVPEHNGYYVVGSKSEWKYAGAAELTGGEDEQNYAKLLNYTVAKNEAFKVKKYEDGVETWFAINGDESEAGNYVAEAEKAVDIFASKDGKLYVFDHVEPVPAPKYYYSLNGAADVEMAPNGETEVMSTSVSFKAGDELTFKVSESPYEVKTTYAAEPKEDVQYTNVELVDNKLVFAQDYSGSLYLNIEGETGKLWAGHLEGYYLVGTHCGWNVKRGIKAPEKAGEAGTYVLAGVELAANAEVKFYHFGDTVPNQGYVNVSKDYKDEYMINFGAGVDAAVTEDENKNIKFNAGGVFDIYYNTNTNWYSIEKNGYTPTDLDDFLTKFDNDLSAVCNTLGSDDYLLKLKGEWSRQSSAFKLLSATDQKTIRDAGFDYEGEGKLGTMIAKYRYIVLKYGTDNCPDFIWGKNYGGRVGNAMPELSTDSNVMLIVIISISAVSVASLGALLILKKKKRK